MPNSSVSSWKKAEVAAAKAFARAAHLDAGNALHVQLSPTAIDAAQKVHDVGLDAKRLVVLLQQVDQSCLQGGVVSPAAALCRSLVREWPEGLSPDDIALQVDLLLCTIKATLQARKRNQARLPTTMAPGAVDGGGGGLHTTAALGEQRALMANALAMLCLLRGGGSGFGQRRAAVRAALAALQHEGFLDACGGALVLFGGPTSACIVACLDPRAHTSVARAAQGLLEVLTDRTTMLPANGAKALVQGLESCLVYHASYSGSRRCSPDNGGSSSSERDEWLFRQHVTLFFTSTLLGNARARMRAAGHGNAIQEDAGEEEEDGDSGPDDGIGEEEEEEEQEEEEEEVVPHGCLTQPGQLLSAAPKLVPAVCTLMLRDAAAATRNDRMHTSNIHDFDRAIAAFHVLKKVLDMVRQGSSPDELEIGTVLVAMRSVRRCMVLLDCPPLDKMKLLQQVELFGLCFGCVQRTVVWLLAGVRDDQGGVPHTARRLLRCTGLAADAAAAVLSAQQQQQQASASSGGGGNGSSSGGSGGSMFRPGHLAEYLWCHYQSDAESLAHGVLALECVCMGGGSNGAEASASMAPGEQVVSRRAGAPEALAQFTAACNEDDLLGKVQACILGLRQVADGRDAVFELVRSCHQALF